MELTKPITRVHNYENPLEKDESYNAEILMKILDSPGTIRLSWVISTLNAHQITHAYPSGIAGTVVFFKYHLRFSNIDNNTGALVEVTMEDDAFIDQRTKDRLVNMSLLGDRAGPPT